MKHKAYLLLFFMSILIAFYQNSTAQSLEFPAAFQQKLEVTQIDIFTPLEGKYKSIRSKKNDFQPIDFTLFSRQEDLEIRYAVLPYSEENAAHQIPSVDFMRAVSSTATNEEEAVIAVHGMDESDLEKHFNADWGRIAFFQPKAAFSDRKHCRLLGLFKEGKGIVYVFFLFDEPNRALDNRFYSLRFRTKI